MTCFQCVENIVQIECCCTQEFSLISTTKQMSTEIQQTSQHSAMFPVTPNTNNLDSNHYIFSKIAGVWEAFSHSFLWRYFLLFYCSSMCAGRETVHLLSSFSTLTSAIFLPLQLSSCSRWHLSSHDLISSSLTWLDSLAIFQDLPREPVCLIEWWHTDTQEQAQ